LVLFIGLFGGGEAAAERVFYLPFFFAKNFMKSHSLRERLQRHPFL